MLAVGLAGYGYVTGDTWVIVASVVVSVIGLRKAVFSFDKIGALANFVILIAGVVLGALNFTNVKLPSFPDSGMSEQEVAKKITQPANVPNKQPTVVVPIVKSSPPPNIIPRRVYTPEFAKEIPCANQALFDGMMFGKNDVEDIYIKICRSSKEVKISHVPNNPKMVTDLQKGQYLGKDKRLWRGQDFLNITFLENQVVLSPKVDVMKKHGIEFLIMTMYIDHNFVVD